MVFAFSCTSHLRHHYIASEDYVPIFETLEFNGTTRECTSLKLWDDSIIENTEDFSVVLITSDSKVITTTPYEARIIILNSDGKLIQF